MMYYVNSGKEFTWIENASLRYSGDRKTKDKKYRSEGERIAR